MRVLCDSSGGAGRRRVVCEQDAQSDDRVAQTNHDCRSGQNITIRVTRHEDRHQCCTTLDAGRTANESSNESCNTSVIVGGGIRADLFAKVYVDIGVV